jgi:hypothetical protein
MSKMLLDVSNHCLGAISLFGAKLRLLDVSKTRNSSLDMSNHCVGALLSRGGPVLGFRHV